MFALAPPTNVTPIKPMRSATQPQPTQKTVTVSTDPTPVADAVTRTAISLEYASVRHPDHCPLGMYLIPSHNNLLVWDGVFFVHQGYYTDCILKFRMTFPANYPERPPTVQFLTDVFHPLISQNDGVFNIAPQFRPWRPREHHVYDILHWVKAAFKKHALDEIKETECFNKEAFRLYHESTSSFAALATQSSMLSQSASALFDRDHPSMAGKGSHDIAFRELKKEQIDAMRNKLGLREWEDEEPHI